MINRAHTHTRTPIPHIFYLNIVNSMTHWQTKKPMYKNVLCEIFVNLYHHGWYRNHGHIQRKCMIMVSEMYFDRSFEPHIFICTYLVILWLVYLFFYAVVLLQKWWVRKPRANRISADLRFPCVAMNETCGFRSLSATGLHVIRLLRNAI